MKLSELGEFGLIARTTRQFTRFHANEIQGIGDDCAVIDQGNGTVLLVTTDILMDRIHFLRDKIPPELLGRKSLNVNLSDIAAMGGKPLSFFISIAIPENIPVDYLDRFFNGIREAADSEHVSLLGGDTTGSKQDLAINILVLGEADSQKCVLRSTARNGDIIQVSGPLGASAAGLHLLLSEPSETEWKDYAELIEAHFDPRARLATGQALAQIPGVSAMIDISDGLIQDLGHICEQSSLSGTIRMEHIPFNPLLMDLSRKHGIDPWKWILAGGEDYELCWTVSPEYAHKALQAARESGAPAPTTIGKLESGTGITVIAADQTRTFPNGGWNHFQTNGEIRTT